MSKTTQNKETLLAEAIVTINNKSSVVEQLAIDKKGIQNPTSGVALIVKEIETKSLADIKEASEKAKAEIIEVLKTLSVQDACKVATAVCSSPEGSDDKLRSRMQRRRNSLCKTLSLVFTTYEFYKTKIAQTAVIQSNFVGDEFMREARKIKSMLHMAIENGFIAEDTKIPSLTIMAKTLTLKAGITYTVSEADTGLDSADETLKKMELAVFEAVKAKNLESEKAGQQA